MNDASNGPARTRRQFLRRAGGTVVAGTAVTGATTAAPVAAQNLLRRQLVFEDVAGVEIESNSHYVVLADLVREADREIDPSAVEGCNVVEFSPDETRTYEGIVVDRLRQDPQGYERQILTHARDERLPPGSVFIVSNAEPCSDGYVGVEAEAISDEFAPYGAETAQPADPGSGPIPGFRLAGAVAALAGVLGLARWRSGDDAD
ncbi:hypothetical protein [Haloarchaeobius sp. HRN-SO-5]|uniref:hypothetical protein n=1 Tax=Haloarchaeobius sp. HRN-SO-5 TaxID=3446118 RepID=UPI003EBCEF81